MQIGEVIRTYRKKQNLTQEEMANRLGVSAPAVNKWENGSSLPDISMLTPVARLLEITPDILLSFQEDVSQEEINQIVQEVDKKFQKEESYEDIFQFVKKKIARYPNSERLAGQLAMIMDAWRILRKLPASEQTEEYDRTIREWYQAALKSEDEEVRERAADSLYTYYYRNEQYEEAEKYLNYFSRKNPLRKIHQAMLYRKQGKTQDAYRAYEELLFQGHNVLEIAMQNIQLWAIEDGNMEKARFMTEKLKNMENIFDMGDYYEVSAELSLAQAEKDADATAACMEKLLDSAGKLDAYASSPLYEHMEFKPLSPEFAAHLKETLQKSAREDESYSFMKGNKKWESLAE